ncbi:hypothetical protein [Subtercola frigoramans]|uniref:Histidine kinase n=1 Tax=Subtercola frigoramans TaxID=120298 RepID=A0ABS2LAD1_9MICO|nr:hypothetical protein [Subtercola frigoramans]MBM7473431.1 hypothetical protein [Subtercola frigoramans]
MSETAQEIDPLGGITARIFVRFVAIISVGTAVTMALLNGREISSLPLELTAIALLIAGYAYFIWAADPYRRRVSSRDYAIVLSCLLLAAVAESFAQLGSDLLVRNDWAPLCLGLVLMLGGPYRTPLFLVACTVVALAVVAVTTWLNTPTLGIQSPLIALTVTGTPVLALGGGAALYSGYLIAGLKRARIEATEAREARELADRREVIEEFLGHNIANLRRDVLPFFRHIKAQDALTPADIDQAAELSERLRASLAANALVEPLAELVGVYRDPLTLAHRLTQQQRAAIRTLLLFLSDQPEITRERIELSLALSGADVVGVLEAHLANPDRTAASQLAPFIGLMQLAFATAEEDISADRVAVRFTI